MRLTGGEVRDGGEPIGIGIPGLTPSLSFQVTGFSIARSAGVSILRGGCIRLRSSGTDMGTVAGAAMDMDTLTIISVQIRATGAMVLIMWEGAITPTVSITDRDPQEVGSIPDLAWLAQRAASEDSVALASTAEEVVFMEAVAGSTAEEVAVAFTEEAAGFTVGNR